MKKIISRRIMTYLFKLPPELMAHLVEIRERTGKPLAAQVREAVRRYCEMEDENTRHPQG